VGLEAGQEPKFDKRAHAAVHFPTVTVVAAPSVLVAMFTFDKNPIDTTDTDPLELTVVTDPLGLKTDVDTLTIPADAWYSAELYAEWQNSIPIHINKKYDIEVYSNENGAFDGRNIWWIGWTPTGNNSPIEQFAKALPVAMTAAQTIQAVVTQNDNNGAHATGKLAIYRHQVVTP
jgi:hypothetical protein